MFCPKCNTEVPDGSAYCLNCGASLASSGRSLFHQLWLNRGWRTRWILIGSAAAIVALATTVPLFATGVLTGGGGPSPASLVSETPQPSPSPSPPATVERTAAPTPTREPTPTETVPPPSTGPVDVQFDLPEGLEVVRGGTFECEVPRKDLLSRIYSAFDAYLALLPPGVDRLDLDNAQEEELLEHLWRTRTFQGAPHLTAEQADFLTEQLAGEPLTQFAYQGIWLIENNTTSREFEIGSRVIEWSDGGAQEDTLDTWFGLDELEPGGAGAVSWGADSGARIEAARIIVRPSSSSSARPAQLPIRDDATIIDHQVTEGVHSFSIRYHVSGSEEALRFPIYELDWDSGLAGYLYNSKDELIAMIPFAPFPGEGEIRIELVPSSEVGLSEGDVELYDKVMWWPRVGQSSGSGYTEVNLERANCTPSLTDPNGYRLDVVSYPARVIASVELPE